jgi:hypothetical protein
MSRKGKFSSLRDELVWTKSLDTSWLDDEMGDTDAYGLHHALILDFYGRDYIVTTNSVGFVDVESYASTFVDSDGVLKRSAEAGNRWCDLYDAFRAFEQSCEDSDPDD